VRARAVAACGVPVRRQISPTYSPAPRLPRVTATPSLVAVISNMPEATIYKVASEAPWLNSSSSGSSRRVTTRQDNNLGLTEDIYYDNDYRFSYSKLNSVQNLSVTYDVTGNITSRSDVAGGATWTYDPARKHAVTQAGSSAYNYSYDPNGNAITRQGSSIAWSSYNYPTSVSAGSGSTAEDVTLAYGPDRQRWQQTYSGNGISETTDYVGDLLEIVSSGGVTDYRQYISANGRAVAVYSRKSTGTNTFSYLGFDHQGSVASITNGSGGPVVNESFTPFGSRRNPTTWSGAASTSDLTASAGITREGYTFQTALGLWMGLNHMNGRVQDSVTGRFLSPDPYVQDIGNTGDYNRYSYTRNNPVTYSDPTGYDVKDCLGDDSSPTDNLSITNNMAACLPQVTVATPHVTALVDVTTSLLQSQLEQVVVVAANRQGTQQQVGQQIPCPLGVACYTQPQGNQPTSEVTVRATPCPSQDLSLSRPSYGQRVQQDADAANQALGTGMTKVATVLGTGALSNDIFGTSAVTPFQTWWAGGESVVTDLGVLSGVSRVGTAVGVRLLSGAAVYGAWRAGNYAGAIVGNISLRGGPTITDAVSSFIEFEANGPSGAEPSSCGP
jgi:RHS repeat-associated protein